MQLGRLRERFPFAVGRVMGLVRRGPRTVVWTERGIHLGNFPYHWMRAYTGQRQGRDVHALRTPEMERWLAAFPTAAPDLLIAREDVRPTDRRETGYFRGHQLLAPPRGGVLPTPAGDDHAPDPDQVGCWRAHRREGPSG